MFIQSHYLSQLDGTCPAVNSTASYVSGKWIVGIYPSSTISIQHFLILSSFTFCENTFPELAGSKVPINFLKHDGIGWSTPSFTAGMQRVPSNLSHRLWYLHFWHVYTRPEHDVVEAWWLWCTNLDRHWMNQVGDHSATVGWDLTHWHISSLIDVYQQKYIDAHACLSSYLICETVWQW